MKAWVVAATLCLVAVFPRLAEACPYCAGTNDGGIGRYLVIGAMVITPFIAAAICAPLVIRAVRRTDEESTGHE